ncbi:hypothetical protein AYO21_00431 [Fonsecaea monophora]|uniref:T6SS Phospholipase effector Tle1-like catalytic domain-containing protein n=1 Tax=Fonsecaea monophora TaxID=254056 RepID=A0A177FL87_9EURO|nr:hypothetical protein AYO21_00431 [Fonsecaea monophora]OAG45083.1 hypothetical protein AYO21_00431 [Fonsecaea monophora]
MGTLAPPTNVSRLARAVDRHGVDYDDTTKTASTISQVVHYESGVGTYSVLPRLMAFDYLYSGLSGKGIEKSILNAYSFLCNNNNFGAGQDEIILVGFSRGAFAVRCLAAFITQIGLIRRRHLFLLATVFENWWQNRGEIDEK